ncbi:MAG: UDP-3-O-acyl-N-acetylglucosamine deacetylase [Bryobacterales bacterium]|nr:UDP-3-O-acyl-N-acetylglucosamine deacetylase [Bryobacterales bacterium]
MHGADLETTLERPVSTQGVGLHHGVPVSMTLRPAPAGSGIVFRRTDLDGFAIRAAWKHVARVSYATSLMRQGVLLSTTEHLLSCLYAMQIDNAVVEIDNLEVPILDGSSLPFIEMLREAGRRTQRREREYLAVTRQVRVADGVKSIVIEPSDSFQLRCETHFDHPLVGKGEMELELTPEIYAEEIAPARTFGFERDLAQMRDMGLIRGATLESAVCFADSGVLNPGGLRFDDEPCRHKVLDLIGDLALIGKPLLGRVVAKRAGHAMHAALVRKIMSDPSCYEVVSGARMAVSA